MRAIVISLIALLAASCGESVPDVSSGNVTFFNESGYSVSVSLGAFPPYGVLLVDTLAPGGSYTTTVSTSDNSGIGSMFSIIYFFCAGGNACTTGRDPELQIQRNLAAGQSYEIQIPNPNPLTIEWPDSFLKIQNSSDMPFRFTRSSIVFKDASTEEFSVPAGETGIYRINSSNFFDLEIKDCSITLTLGTTIPFPDFTAEKGYICNFRFDGNEVEHLWDEEI
jgi:hypothetical protein